MKRLNLLMVLATAVLCGCAAPRISRHAPTLSIPRGTITVDASAEDWGDDRQLSTLTNAHDHTTPDGTRVALCYDNTKLYFLFEAVDADVMMGEEVSNGRIGGHDRVELFFSADRKMNFYCGAEMAETGVLDHGGKYHRKSIKDWSFRTLNYRIIRTEEGYLAEGSFDLQELRELGLIGRNGRIYLGVFRGDRPADNGRFRWFSWVVAKRLKRPDFHHPYSQGVAYLR